MFKELTIVAVALTLLMKTQGSGARIIPRLSGYFNNCNDYEDYMDNKGGCLMAKITEKPGKIVKRPSPPVRPVAGSNTVDLCWKPTATVAQSDPKPQEKPRDPTVSDVQQTKEPHYIRNPKPQEEPGDPTVPDVQQTKGSHVTRDPKSQEEHRDPTVTVVQQTKEPHVTRDPKPTKAQYQTMEPDPTKKPPEEHMTTRPTLALISTMRRTTKQPYGEATTAKKYF